MSVIESLISADIADQMRIRNPIVQENESDQPNQENAIKIVPDDKAIDEEKNNEVGNIDQINEAKIK